MCYRNFVGFSCGHEDPDGTPLAPTPCSPPRRLRHEPFCDPLTDRIRTTGWARCPTCTHVLAQLRGEWNTARQYWRDNRLLPVAYIDSLNRDLIREFALIQGRAYKAGPKHSVYLEYGQAQQSLMNRALDLMALLSDLYKKWNSVIARLRSYGTIPEEMFREAVTERDAASIRFGTNTNAWIDVFEELLRDLQRYHDEQERRKAESSGNADPSG
ncbi:hypothetical protein GGR57DRAFT_515453 [Xylariaceae sp. FL1272]|nr:hypothetical protein GGR57DRAFT_515453 [Xylariaceae sp. FL1272]